eukprot:jgi/Chrzof1/3842/Cz13g10230.t1
MQGSHDLEDWVDLRSHVNDSSIRLPGQYATWPVMGRNAAVPYRAFRIWLAAPTCSATSPWNLCISYLELYGYFYHNQEGSSGEGGSSSSQADGTPSGAGCAAAALPATAA